MFSVHKFLALVALLNIGHAAGQSAVFEVDTVNVFEHGAGVGVADMDSIMQNVQARLEAEIPAFVVEALAANLPVDGERRLDSVGTERGLQPVLVAPTSYPHTYDLWMNNGLQVSVVALGYDTITDEGPCPAGSGYEGETCVTTVTTASYNCINCGEDAPGIIAYVEYRIAQSVSDATRSAADDAGGALDVQLVSSSTTVSIPRAAAIDDPHFETWNGRWFDFMGECSLVLIQAPFFSEAAGLDIHIRTKIRYDYSYIESAVVKVGDEYLEVGSFGAYFLNGVGDATMPATLGGYPVILSRPTSRVMLFEIQIAKGEKITIKTFKDLVSVSFDDANADRFIGSSGMLGEYPTGKMLARDGKTEITDPIAYANEWQVRNEDHMLFNAIKGPQHPAQCKLPTQKNLRLANQVSRAVAEDACAKFSGNKEACIQDVMKTGDVDIAMLE